jgi:putative ABC transport system permease protein
VSDETWREWRRRPQVDAREAAYLESRLDTPAIFSRLCDQRTSVSVGGRSAADIEIVAADPAYFTIKSYEFAAGRPFTPQEAKAGLPVIVLGFDVADGLFPGVDAIGRSVTVGDLPYRVIGVVARQGTLFGMSLDKFGVAPFESAAQRLACRPGAIDELHIQAQGPTAMAAALTSAEELMRVRRRLRPAQDNNFALQTAEGALAGWRKISTVLFAALPGLVAISLVVGGIVIMNIMLMAVAERTREIGIRKALGAKRADILAQFIIESATISVIGAAIGIALGIGLAFLVRATTPLPAAIAPWSVGLAVVLGVAVGMAAGVYPASRASKLDPIDALRAE